MKNLTPPVLNACDIYKSIKNNSLKQRKKNRLEELEQHIFERYSQYEDNKNNLEHLSASIIDDLLDKEILESCYTRNKDGYFEGQVVSRIISDQSPQHKNKCPYCGIDKPRTIDHYLPETTFAEFIVLPINLIPCCSHCNSKKNKRWLNNHNKRMFINFYFDILPIDKKFISVELQFDSNERNHVPTVLFRLINNSEIDVALFELIESHYTHLSLLREYSEIVAEEISNIYDTIIHNLDIGIGGHKDNLGRQLHMLRRQYGLNYWKAVFYEGLIEDNTFFERIYRNVT